MANKFSFSLTTIENLPECPDVEYYSTGIEVFDNNYRGICKRGMTLIGAYPAHGKSLFTLDLAIKIAENNPNVSVYYFSCENDPSDDLSRIKWLHPHLNLPDKQFIYTNTIGFDKWEDRLDNIQNSDKECIIFIDSPAALVENATSEYEAMVKLVRKLSSISMKHPLVTNWHLQRPNSKDNDEVKLFKDLTGGNFGNSIETWRKSSYCYFVDYQGGDVPMMFVRCGKFRGKRVKDNLTISGNDAIFFTITLGEDN